MYLYFKITI